MNSVNPNSKYKTIGEVAKILDLIDKKNGLPSRQVFKVGEGRPNIVDEIKNKKISLVINTPMGSRSRYDEQEIGRSCIRYGVLAVTTLSGANAVLRAIRCSSEIKNCLLYTSPSPRDLSTSRMPSSA